MPSTTGVRTAYAYARHSTKEQGHGDSRRRQQAKAEAWAAKNRYALVHIYDDGRSAYSGSNRTIGQFGAFLAALRAGELGRSPVILVENLDRVSREELEVAQGLFLEIINAGATVVTLHNEKSYKRPLSLTDIILALIEMEAAHNYSARLSERVKAAYEERKKSGAIVHTKTSSPRWLTLNQDRTGWVVNEERAKLVRWIYVKAASGRGAESIARELNDKAIAPWSRSNAWLGSTVDDLLKNPATLGEFQGRKGYFPAVVSPELWQAVNDRVVRAARGRGRGQIRELNLVRGLCTSAVDGTPMILRQSGSKDPSGRYRWYHYLTSTGSIAGKTKPPHRVPYHAVEERILWLASNFDRKLLERARNRKGESNAERIELFKAAEQRAAKKVARLLRQIAEEDDPPRSIVEMIRVAEREYEEAKERLSSFRRMAPKRIEPVKANEVTTPEARSALRAELARCFESILVDRNRIVVRIGESDGIVMDLEGELRAYVDQRKKEQGDEYVAGMDVENPSPKKRMGRRR